MKINVLNYRHEIDDFKKRLEKCENVYNRCGFIYIIAYGLIAVISLIFSVLQLFSLNYNWIDTLLDGVIFKAAIFVPAYLSVYKKENKYILFAAAITAINVLTAICISHCGGMMLTIDISLAVLSVDCFLQTAAANNDYHFLEKQFGFPYFNEINDDKQFDKVTHNIESTFRTSSENRKKTASDSMEKITVSERISARKVEKNNYMNDVALSGESSSDLTFKTEED